MKNRNKALLAASVLSLGIYTGAKLKSMSNEAEISNSSLIIQSIYDEDDNLDYSFVEPIQINEEDFIEFDHERLFTLFDGTQLFDYLLQGTNLCPDVLNHQNVVVRGIGTNGDFTLIELPNGQRKYVYSNDIVESISFNRNEFGHMDYISSKDNDDYSVNKNAYVYNRDGICVGYLEEGTRCLEIARTDEYMFVITSNNDYLFIDLNDVSLTKELHKGLFPPKKIAKSKEALDSRNIYYDYENGLSTTQTIYKVYFDNENFVDNETESYCTLCKNQPIYFKNGSIDHVSYGEGVVVKVLRESDDIAYVMFNDGTKGYVNKKALCNALVLDRNTFSPVIRNRNQITTDWEHLYDINGAFQSYIYPNTSCIALETDGTYTLIELEDGTRGYIQNVNLIPSENQVSRFVYLKSISTCYFRHDGGDMVEYNFETPEEGGITYLFFIDGEYAYVGDYLCRENWYVKLTDIDFNYDIESVFSYGYVSKDTNMNSEIDGTGELLDVDDFDLYWVYYNCGEYSYVGNASTRQYGYIKTSELNLLPGDFYYVDLDNQRAYFYDDNDGGRYSCKEWPIRSGNDANPSHEGAWDIDWKAKDFAFTSYPGAHARYWIPFNEFDEGFHDLVGDDEQNYGNELYHTIGSHGCIRVPVEASEFIYNTSPVGTKVLVNRK